MIRSRAVLPLLLLAVACGAKQDHRAATPSARSAATPAPDSGTPAVVADESEDAVRARALATIDGGDILAGDKLLRELAKRRATAVGTRGIIKALESCALKDVLKNCMLENFGSIDVMPLPPPSSSTPKKRHFVAKPLRRDPAEPNPDAALFHTMSPTTRMLPRRGVERHVPETYEKPGFLPMRFGGSDLVLTKWTGKHWLVVYGRGHRDGRFVAIVDQEGRPIRVLDFRAWRATQNALVEVGIVSVDMAGDVVYVRQQSNASEGYLAAVDSKTGKTLWRSERVGMSTHFVVGDEHVVLWTYGGGSPQAPVPQGFTLLDRSTGDVVARIPTTYVVGTVVPIEGAIIAYGGGPGLSETNRVEIKTGAHPIAPPKRAPEPPKEGVVRLPTFVTNPADTKATLDAWATLDAGKTVEAIVLLRDIFDRRPGSLALSALLHAASADAEEQRDQVLEAFSAHTPTPVTLGRPANGNLAPIPRSRPSPPRLRLVEEKETRRHPSTWFADVGIAPNKFEIDERPSGAPILPVPVWLPPGRSEEMTTPNGEQTVAVYGWTVAVFRPDKLAFHLGLDHRSPDLLGFRFADAIGNVLLASIRERLTEKGFLVAIDMKAAALLWRTPDVFASSFVLVDGYIIASADLSGKKPEYVVLEGDTGRVVSRMTTPKSVASFPNRLARDGTTLWSFNDIMTARFTIE